MKLNPDSQCLGQNRVQGQKSRQQIGNILSSSLKSYLKSPFRSGVGTCTGKKAPNGLVAELQSDPVATRRTLQAEQELSSTSFLSCICGKETCAVASMSKSDEEMEESPFFLTE